MGFSHLIWFMYINKEDSARGTLCDDEMRNIYNLYSNQEYTLYRTLGYTTEDNIYIKLKISYEDDQKNKQSIWVNID